MPEKKFRVLEIFGPTIQGEGRHVGVPCVFIRFGGCDYRCSWCDSPHAVLPHLVSQAEQLTAEEIVRRVEVRPGAVRWVVLSGGNPVLFDLGYLVNRLQTRNYKVMVETQGSIYKRWLTEVDEVCFSPKPPSSGNMTSPELLNRILGKFWADNLDTMDPGSWTSSKVYLKIPIFWYEDYLYAQDIHRQFPSIKLFLSVGNQDPNLPTVGNNAEGDPNMPVDKIDLLHKMRWLMEKVANDPHMGDVRVLPQLHVLAWGNERGR